MKKYFTSEDTKGLDHKKNESLKNEKVSPKLLKTLQFKKTDSEFHHANDIKKHTGSQKNKTIYCRNVQTSLNFIF